MRPKSSTIFAVCAIAITILMVLSASQTSFAQISKYQELRELEYQLNILQLTKDLNIITRDLRDHIRPLDNVDYASNKLYLGTMSRNILKLTRELGKEMASAPQWLKRTEKDIDVAHRAAATADLVLRSIRAIEENKSSSGVENLKDLAEIIKDISTILPALVAVNPVIGVYISLMTKAMKNIAKNLEIIEAATKKKNWAIKEAGKAVGGKYLESVESEEEHPLDKAIDAAKKRIRELRYEIDLPRYNDVRSAEKRCYKKLNITAGKVWEMEYKLGAYNSRILSIKETIEYDKRLVGALKELLKSSKAEIDKLKWVTPDLINKEERQQLEKAKKDVRCYESEMNYAETRLSAKIRASTQKLRNLEMKKSELEEKVEKIYECIRNYLKKWAKFADEKFLKENYPKYWSLPKPEGLKIIEKDEDWAEEGDW